MPSRSTPRYLQEDPKRSYQRAEFKVKPSNGDQNAEKVRNKLKFNQNVFINKAFVRSKLYMKNFNEKNFDKSNQLKSRFSAKSISKSPPYQQKNVKLYQVKSNISKDVSIIYVLEKPGSKIAWVPKTN